MIISREQFLSAECQQLIEAPELFQAIYNESGGKPCAGCAYYNDAQCSAFRTLSARVLVEVLTGHSPVDPHHLADVVEDALSQSRSILLG